MSIKRYAAHTNIDDFKSDWHESKDGPMVKHEDYAALEQQLAESQREFRSADATIENLQMQVEKLAAENAGLKNAMYVTMEHVSVMDTGQSGVAAMIINDALRNSETPSTDAFLAEVRASAIEHAASERWGSGYTFDVLNEFAAQLRQGVQS
jgi:DNA repair ATPase RecN